MGVSFCLRHRMLHFLQNFIYYMTLEVIGPRAHEMTKEMEGVQDMDQLLSSHERFLDSCLKECLLASQDLLKLLTKIMTTCLLFADQMIRFTGAAASSLSSGHDNNKMSEARALGIARQMRQVRIQARSEYIRSETTHDAYTRTLDRFATTFDGLVVDFLERLWTDSHRNHPQLSNLCVRLDYNGFYSGVTQAPGET